MVHSMRRCRIIRGSHVRAFGGDAVNNTRPQWKLDWKVGDVCYTCHENNGWRQGSYAAKFSERKIIGETSRSWLVGSDWHFDKYPKKPCPDVYRHLYTSEMVQAEVYRHDHAHKIADKVRGLSPETLRKVAELIGYNIEATP